jgi:hypothetical protein
LPATWDEITVSNIKVPNGTVAMTVARVPAGLDLQVENSGAPVDLAFNPEIPLGAHLRGATLDGKSLVAHEEENDQDTHAALLVKVPNGKSDCVIRYEGGISVSVKHPAPLVGGPSKGIKIISIAYKAKRLVVEADVSDDAPSSIIDLRTGEHPVGEHGAKLITVKPGEYELAVEPQAQDAGYRRVEITVDFAADKR